MAINVVYDPATNRITVTGGTESVPAVFDDIVAFDRAGTLKLLEGTIDADPDTFSLDRQVRPVELRALQLSITCIARAGATVDIAGKDFRGNAISENGIDVSSGSATTTKYFSEVDADGITVHGLQVDDEFDIEQSQWGRIWDTGQNTYILDASLYVGDGYASTYFKDLNKIIILTDAVEQYPIKVYRYATLQLGELVDEATKQTCNGCVIHVMKDNDNTRLFQGWGTPHACYLYGCTISSLNKQNRRCVVIGYGSDRFWNCSFVNYVHFLFYGDSDVYNTTIMGGTDANKITSAYYLFQQSEPTLDDVKAFNVLNAISAWITSLTIKRIVAVADRAVFIDYFSGDRYLKLLNCEFNNWIMYDPLGGATGVIDRAYTVNIHVADKDGVSLPGVNVVCKDKDDNEVFSVNTDENGDIVEQEVAYQRWTDFAYGENDEEDATCFSPHKFIISKTGYETLELEEITVDGIIDWHFELQEPTTCDYPSEDDVEKDVEYDSGAKIGNFAVPAEVEVKEDIGYGALGTEFLGILEAGALLRGTNLLGQLEAKVNLEAMLDKSVNLIGSLQKKTNMVGTLREVEAEGG